jgi:metallo-beta-lactamase family protein
MEGEFMKIQFCGATRTVTGSCYYLEANGRKFLVDCGLFQGKDEELNNKEFPFNPAELDFVLVTHAHIDHSGRIPLLIKRGFTGTIYCTSATADLLDIMLRDSGHIHESEAEWENRKRERKGLPPIEPLYTVADAALVAQHIQEVSYNAKQQIDQNIIVNFKDAGHLLGSSIIEIFVEGKHGVKKIVFSGDLGNFNIPIIKDYEYVDGTDYLVIESTYGNRYHDVAKGSNELADIIINTVSKGGNVIIPTFAVGRTQELLYILRQYINEDKIKQLLDIEFYVDSPLAKEATRVFEEHIECYDEDALKVLANEHFPFNFPNLHFTSTPQESLALNEKQGIVIISSSGMCDAGRVKHHLKHNLWKSNNAVIFVGYQAETTLGRRILYGAKFVKIFGEEIAVKAKVYNLPGLSGHADLEGLLKWVSNIKNGVKKSIFITHGEEEANEHFMSELNHIKAGECIIPYLNETYNL